MSASQDELHRTIDLIIPRPTTGIRVDAIRSMAAVNTSMLNAIRANRPWLMTFANPATSIAVSRHPEFGAMLNDFDIVAPDGVGLVLAMKLIHRQPALRISFDSTSLAPHVFRFAVKHRLAVVLCGGVPGVAATARDTITAAYPGIRIVGAFDGYRDQDEIIAEIGVLNPGIVIAGMGAIVQEKFLFRLVERGWIGLGFTCGGYLDQLSIKGTNYYPAWIDRYNLRWAYRLAMEPRRLWRRYLLEYPEFGLRLAANWLRRGR